MTINNSIKTIALSGLLTVAGIFPTSLLAQSEQDPRGGMAKQLAKMGGQMQVMAKNCGHYTAEELETMKVEQRQAAANFAMSEEAFNKFYAEGEREIEARWKTMSSDERTMACKEMNSFKQQSEAAAEALNQ